MSLNTDCAVTAERLSKEGSILGETYADAIMAGEDLPPLVGLSRVTVVELLEKVGWGNTLRMRMKGATK